MKTVCKHNKCAGCMACVNICTRGAIKIADEMHAYNAVIDEIKCNDCGACYRVCQKNNPPKAISCNVWYQGWAKDCKVRCNSASGGIATAVSQAFIDIDGIVYSCIFEKGQFIFIRADSSKEINKFSGTKYIKSNPDMVYKNIKRDLKERRKVLFIGLPCQVAAVLNYVGENKDTLYTIDLICHGTPSPKVLDLFLKQYNLDIGRVHNICFRTKSIEKKKNSFIGTLEKGVQDRYTIAFLNGLTYTENCYECDYAQFERVSDLTLGDSWGTEMCKEEKKRGISLVLCQTKKGERLLRKADVELYDVDIERATSNNCQLNKPPKCPPKRDDFWNRIIGGTPFNKVVYRHCMWQCIKQDIKNIFLKLGIIKSENRGILDYEIRIEK